VIGRFPILDVHPLVECGRYPAKAVVGEPFRVEATVIREGHDSLGANVVLRDPKNRKAAYTPMRRAGDGSDRWWAEVRCTAEGRWTFQIEAWSDPVGSWRHDAEIKVPAEIDVSLVMEEGARVHERAAAGVPARQRPLLEKLAATLRDPGLPPLERLAAALDPAMVALLDKHPLRDGVTAGERCSVLVDRERALFSAWYELFPRSEGASLDPPRHGTFKDAALRLPAVAAMGFDIVYLPPIHPIGTSFRKGPNNTLNPGPDDPGSPWAIGSEYGGHDAVHPELGTLEDFDAFVAAAADCGLEVALDLALQASPDHPWAKEHPEWFTTRADGSIAYAENPPKKYQDIYPINFDNDPEGIYAEVLRIVRHWMAHGVRVFRVDNPHTKPVQFWERLLAEVRSTDPDVLFLSEAFTKPAMMHALGKVGFHQSYTYFTWRTFKGEVEDYLREVSQTTAHFMRPSFWVNTPDILHEYLQSGGPPAFKVRAVLAALGSPSWGVYSGYELFEHVAVRPGSEEYLDSEKYQFRPRDWAGAERTGRSLTPYLTKLNTLRRDHPALHLLRNLVVHPVDGDALICFSKREGTDAVITVLNLDPHRPQEGVVHLDREALGLRELGIGPEDSFDVYDELSGQVFHWSGHDYVRLDPFVEPAHILVVRGRA
jgi:starch synthase (maltosyl-transferring)